MNLDKELTEANNDPIKMAEIEEKITLFEQELIRKEIEKRESFTILRDEKPSQAFLNIESRTQNYNEICKLRVPNPNYNHLNKEDDSNPKYVTSYSQSIIRKHVTNYFQDIFG